METPLAIEENASKTSKTLLSFWLPKGLLQNLFLWAFLPVALLMFTVWVGFLTSVPFNSFFPLVVLLGPLACCLWKTKGLFVSYLILFSWLFFTLRNVPNHQYLMQIGIAFCLVIDYFIVLLSVNEIKASVEKLLKISQQQVDALHQANIEIEQIQQANEEEKQQLEQQINEFKEKAEQREIEKQQDHKRFELIQSEIEMLTEQKEQFITDAFEARQEANQDANFQILWESQEKILSLQAALSQKGSTHLIAKEISEFEEEVDQLEEEISCLEELVSHVLSQ